MHPECVDILLVTFGAREGTDKPVRRVTCSRNDYVGLALAGLAAGDSK